MAAAPLVALLLLPVSTSGFSFKSPFLRSDPSLYAGRWKITSSNRVGNDLGDEIMVEIERPNTFRAIGYQDKKLYASRTLRCGCFHILEKTEDCMLGELEFREDQQATTSLAGIDLPEPIPTKSQDLGNKKRRVRIYDLDMDRMVIRFVDSEIFYVLERRMEPLERNGLILQEIVATQIVTVGTSILFEILRNEILKAFQ